MHPAAPQRQVGAPREGALGEQCAARPKPHVEVQSADEGLRSTGNGGVTLDEGARESGAQGKRDFGADGYVGYGGGYGTSKESAISLSQSDASVPHSFPLGAVSPCSANACDRGSARDGGSVRASARTWREVRSVSGVRAVRGR